MNLLIINTIGKNDSEIQHAINLLTKNSDKYKIIDASNLNISHCTGCCECMLDTPGECCLNDDFNSIFTSIFDYQNIVIIADTIFDFIEHKAINIMQRMFPLATVLATYKNNKILHIPRYHLQMSLTLLYSGNINKNMLSLWFKQYAEHFNALPIGVYSITDIEEALKCIS